MYILLQAQYKEKIMILNKYLSDRGITKRFFASKIGVSEATLQRIIKGECIPTLLTAVNIETETGGIVTCKILLDIKKNEKKNKYHCET